VSLHYDDVDVQEEAFTPMQSSNKIGEMLLIKWVMNKIKEEEKYNFLY